MDNEELTKYIKSQLAKGISLEQIKQNLFSSGWSEADINEAIGVVQQSPQIPREYNNEQEIPTGVKIISVLYYIGAVIAVIFGLVFLTGAGAGFIRSITIIGPLESLGMGLFVVVSSALIMMGIGVLGFFIGRGLWNARNWARIVTIIFSCLFALIGIIFMSLRNIITLFGLVINVVIIWYLLFNDKVKDIFSKNKTLDHIEQLPIKKSKNLLLILIIILIIGGGIYFSNLFTPIERSDSSDDTSDFDISGAESGFRSDKECNFTPGCRDISYPICFEGHCVKVNDQLRDYVFNKYQHGNLDQILPDGVHAYGLFEEGGCEDISCEGCRIGILLPAFIRDNNYEIRYCVECFGTGTSGCKEGYECLNGKCEEI